MVLEVGLEFAFDTALGTIACTMSPISMAGQMLKVARYLKEAYMTAGVCQLIFQDIQKIAIYNLPILCELLCLGRLFPEDGHAVDLNHTLLGCVQSVCDTLREACIVMYRYLESSMVTQALKASDVEKVANELRTHLTNRFDEVGRFMSLAIVQHMCEKRSEEQVQQMAAEGRELQEWMQELNHLNTADEAQVRALAKAVVARLSPKGQKVKVSEDYVNTVAVSPDPSGKTFATASHDDTAVVWDIATGARLLELRGHSAAVWSVAWAPDASKVVTGSDDKTAAVWDLSSGERSFELRHQGVVTSVAWSPDGSKVATGSHDNTAAVWDAATGICMHELRGHAHRVLSVAWSPDSSRVATASEDNTAAVWDAATGMRTCELRGHAYRRAVTSVAWSPDGSKVATGSHDHTVGVWDAATGERIHELHGRCGGVWSVAWSPDGSRLAAGSDGKTAVVWDPRSGKLMYELKGNSTFVTSVAWSRNGALAFTASDDGTVHIYSVADRHRSKISILISMLSIRICACRNFLSCRSSLISCCNRLAV